MIKESKSPLSKYKVVPSLLIIFFKSKIRTGAEKCLCGDPVGSHIEMCKSHRKPHGLNNVFFSTIIIIQALFEQLLADAESAVGQHL